VSVHRVVTPCFPDKWIGRIDGIKERCSSSEKWVLTERLATTHRVSDHRRKIATKKRLAANQLSDVDHKEHAL